MDKLLLRPSEVSDLIGVGRTRVYAMINAGSLPSVRIGGSVRVTLDALKAWIASLESEAKAS